MGERGQDRLGREEIDDRQESGRRDDEILGDGPAPVVVAAAREHGGLARAAGDEGLRIHDGEHVRVVPRDCRTEDSIARSSRRPRALSRR